MITIQASVFIAVYFVQQSLWTIKDLRVEVYRHKLSYIYRWYFNQRNSHRRAWNSDADTTQNSNCGIFGFNKRKCVTPTFGTVKSFSSPSGWKSLLKFNLKVRSLVWEWTSGSVMTAFLNVRLVRVSLNLYSVFKPYVISMC